MHTLKNMLCWFGADQMRPTSWQQHRLWHALVEPRIELDIIGHPSTVMLWTLSRVDGKGRLQSGV
jgi:hypothetical protein